jgi:hypothetical protein
VDKSDDHCFWIAALQDTLSAHRRQGHNLGCSTLAHIEQHWLGRQ